MNELDKSFVEEIRAIITEARTNIAHKVNITIIHANWLIGQKIVLQEQKGESTANYGDYLIKSLAVRLSSEFGEGFSVTNLKYFRQFYLTFEIGHAVSDQTVPQIGHAVSDQSIKRHQVRNELSWTHYRLLLKVKNSKAREYYLNESISQNWGTRALERQINSLYYERLLSSSEKEPVISEAKKNTELLADSPRELIKNPYVFEFVGLPTDGAFVERDIESALIGNLSQFLLELGKGFAFVARQKHVRTDTKDFFIDLVFYNYYLKCFVLLDLKLGELTHQDIGQMDLYVRLYEDKYKNEGDNPTIGIILCSEKDETIVKYSILSENRNLFASKYLLYLPTEQELATELKKEIGNIRVNNSINNSEGLGI
jgi:predicted nuclease of restriction endonuclease-like (RecB) superfamily